MLVTLTHSLTHSLTHTLTHSLTRERHHHKVAAAPPVLTKMSNFGVERVIVWRDCGVLTRRSQQRRPRDVIFTGRVVATWS